MGKKPSRPETFSAGVGREPSSVVELPSTGAPLPVIGAPAGRVFDVPTQSRPALATDALLMRDAEGSLRVVMPEGEASQLNGTAEDVLSLCSGENTVDEIAQAVSEAYSVDRTGALDDVRSVIRQFLERQIVNLTTGGSSNE